MAKYDYSKLPRVEAEALTMGTIQQYTKMGYTTNEIHSVVKDVHGFSWNTGRLDNIVTFYQNAYEKQKALITMGLDETPSLQHVVDTNFDPVDGHVYRYTVSYDELDESGNVIAQRYVAPTFTDLVSKVDGLQAGLDYALNNPDKYGLRIDNIQLINVERLNGKITI